MRIAIIGAGRVGTALGERWIEAGHDVVYGVRDPDEPRSVERRRATTVQDAASGAEVVVLALPWGSVEQVTTALDVGGAVVIDATNPLAANARELQRDPGSSGARLIAGWLGIDRVVKAFNTTGSANMVDASYPGGIPVMLIAGDDHEAKQLVLDLAADVGFEPVDAGPLAAAADLEHLAMIWIRLAHQLGHGPDIAFSILRR